MIAVASHEVARPFGKPNLADYTFHSFKRSSDTTAADDGDSAQQLISFYGWKSVNMPQEYISSSKHAVMNMASLLSHPAASTVKNSINVEIKTSESTEDPVDTELETSLEPNPSARERSSVQQKSAFIGKGAGGSCKTTKNDNAVMIHFFNGTINL